MKKGGKAGRGFHDANQAQVRYNEKDYLPCGYGTVTLTNSGGEACDDVIEGSGFSMQDAEQILGCE
jgi:hypothetical protein